MALPVTKELFTYHDLEHFPDDGRRREIIEGELIVTAAPSIKHQRIVGRLYFQIHSYFQQHKLGEVFLAPTEVAFSEIDAVQPDLAIILHDGNTELSERRILYAPEWVIEVLSPSTSDYDLVSKKKLYLRHGCIYWIVDPFEETIMTWDVDGHTVYTKEDVAKVSILETFQLKLDELFDAV